MSGLYIFEFDLVEPLGIVAPRMSAGASKIQTLDVRKNDEFTLLCPAQSFPLASFR